jgi:phage-related protein
VKAIISIISSLGDNIGKAFVGIFENGIKPFFEGVFSFFGDFADGALRAFDDFGKGIGQGLENIGQWFKDVFQGIWDFVTGVFRNIGNFFGGIWDGIKNVFTQVAVNIGDAVSGAFKAIVNTVLGFVEGIVNGVVNVINVFADGINWILGAVSGGNASIGRLSQVHFGRLATGGIVEARNGGQLILAGEGGQDEWVVPESKMADMIQKIHEQGGTGGGITINIQGVFATSDAEQRAVAEQIFDKLQEINKSRMGAYL